MKEIAIIMPVYKAHDTIKKTLMSIGMQKAIDFRVYLIVDGEEYGSYDYLQGYCDLDTEIFYMDENGGPGVARQYGIDISVEPFISFCDADDTYLSSLALYYQHKPLFLEDKYVVCSTTFLQENKDHSIRLRENDMVWMHGKMYRRAFLDKYDIRFNETRANEDVGFNTQCQLYANEQEQIYLSQDVTYMWQWRDNSTVRTDNQSYAFNESIDGFVINRIYATQKVLENKEIDNGIKYSILKGQMHLFKKYLVAMLKAPKKIKHVKKWAKKHYFTLYPLVDKEYIEKAEPTALAHTGLDKPEHYEEYKKWLTLLQNDYKRGKRK